MEEEFRHIIVNDKIHTWYSISNLGRVKSHVNKSGDKIIKGTKNAKGARYVNLSFPDHFYDDWKYYSKSSNTVERKLYVHQLVMSAFRPISQFPPDMLKDCWKDIPEPAQKWIADTIIINHIDHNPSNNKLDNLEYVTPRQNTQKAVEFYSIHGQNKKKEIIESNEFRHELFEGL